MIKTHPANKEKPIVIYRSQTEAKNDHKRHQNIKPDNN